MVLVLWHYTGMAIIAMVPHEGVAVAQQGGVATATAEGRYYCQHMVETTAKNECGIVPFPQAWYHGSKRKVLQEGAWHHSQCLGCSLAWWQEAQAARQPAWE